MQVLNPNTGLLSNAEVLKILREDDEESKLASNSIRDRRYQDRKLQRALGKFEHGWNKAEVNKLANPPALSDMRKDLIKHLTEPSLANQHQTPQAVAKLTQALGKFGGGTLTRPEKLQIVNSCPVEMVHLFVIVDRLMERIPDEAEIQQVLDLVKSHLAECERVARNPQQAQKEAEAERTSAQTQEQAQQTLQDEKQREEHITEEIQEEEDELDAFEEEEEEEEDELVAGNDFRSGGRDPDLDIDEAPEGET